MKCSGRKTLECVIGATYTMTSGQHGPCTNKIKVHCRITC